MVLSCCPELFLADKRTVDKMVLKIHLLCILVRKQNPFAANLASDVRSRVAVGS